MENSQKTIKFNLPPLDHMEVFNACAAFMKNDKKTRVDKTACLNFLECAFENRSPNIHLDFNDGSGPNWSPLMVACYYNFKEGVQKLIELGADPNFVNFDDGKSPIEMSAVNSNIEITEILLAGSAQANQRDKHGKNLLLTAIEVNGRNGDKYLEDLLNLNVVDLNESSPEDMTLLQFADLVGNPNGNIIINHKIIGEIMSSGNNSDEIQEFVMDFKI